MSIERLRALEKAVELVAKATPGPWTDEDNRTWVTPLPEVRSGDVKVAKLIGDDFQVTCTVGKYERECANASAIAAAVNFIREHGSALIAELGQEVGAVAWTDDRGLERLREGKQEMVSGVRLGSDTTALYLSPAHTSEARDAAVMKLLDERIAAETNKTRRWALICFRDAAMRQEGGNG